MAEIWMVFGAEEYKYGTYRFVTRAEKNRVNNLAMKLREEVCFMHNRLSCIALALCKSLAIYS